MNTTYCDIGFYDEAPPSLSSDEKLSVAGTVALSLAFSGGLASLAEQALLRWPA